MATQPNIVFVFADQYRANAFGGMDANLKTPNLRRLMQSGVRMDACISTDPVCTPARGSMLTGLYPFHHGATHNNLSIRTDVTTLAKQLRARGYTAGYIGKLHLDGPGKPGFVPPGPRRLGFDDYWAAFNRGHAYWNGVYFTDTDAPISAPGYEPDAQTALAIDFIRREKDRPFCLVMSWGPPHTPHYPHEDHCQSADFHPLDPASIVLDPSVPESEWAQSRYQRAGYYAHVEALDRDVGRLLDALEAEGLRENTIFVFTADHGDLLGEHGRYRKNCARRECLQIPFVISQPGRIPQGKVCRSAFSSVDFMPTLLGLCSCAAPAGLDGEDLSAQLLGAAPERARDVYALCEPGGDALSTRTLFDGRYCLTVSRDEPEKALSLYDWAEDPYEMNNLAGDPASSGQLDALMARLREKIRESGDGLALKNGGNSHESDR